jgi:hypothetical protein
MDQQQRIKELRDKSKRYRALGRNVADAATSQRILELAAEIEQMAREVERSK